MSVFVFICSSCGDRHSVESLDDSTYDRGNDGRDDAVAVCDAVPMSGTLLYLIFWVAKNEKKGSLGDLVKRLEKRVEELEARPLPYVPYFSPFWPRLGPYVSGPYSPSWRQKLSWRVVASDSDEGTITWTEPPREGDS